MMERRLLFVSETDVREIERPSLLPVRLDFDRLGPDDYCSQRTVRTVNDICNSVRGVALVMAYLRHNQGDPCKHVACTIEISSVLLIVLLRAGSTTVAQVVVEMGAIPV
jgi:hypothetical protein